MKNLTIPLTERQVGWIIFTVIFGLLTYGMAYGTFVLGIPSLQVFIPIALGYTWLAFTMDGRHDTNPVHWVGYCLRLKESSTQSQDGKLEDEK